MCSVRLSVLEKIPTADPLAEQAALHVATRDDDGIDGPVLYLGRELSFSQHSSNLHRPKPRNPIGRSEWRFPAKACSSVLRSSPL
jgi:hypothetical protein